MKIVFIFQKKDIAGQKRSLDLVLGYLKDNIQMNYTRWISVEGARVRVSRRSYQEIVIRHLEHINQAIARYLPEFEAFRIVLKPWRTNMFHKCIIRNEAVHIEEDSRNFFIEVSPKENGTGIDGSK